MQRQNFPSARYYNSDLSIWLSVDPMVDKYPNLSPYVYCADNPVRLVDPDGRDWYEVENSETHKMEIKWTEYKSQAEMDKAGIKGAYLGETVVLFAGSRDEKLGKNNNLFGEGAVLAKAKVYGSNNEDDIQEYDAFTMSSDFAKYGAVADGYYDGYNVSREGPYQSHFLVNNGAPVDCLDGINPSPIAPYSSTQKNGIWIHRSNNNGDMLPKDRNGIIHPVSTGCLIIAPTRFNSDGSVKKKGWNEFNNQLNKVSHFKIILRRN